MISDLNTRQLAARASDKIEAKLFYAEKRLQELELQFEGIIACKLEKEQIAESIVAQRREVDTLMWIDDLIQSEINDMNRANKLYRSGC